MGINVVESIFNSKKNLNDFYPQFPGVITFDLHKKHLFYGRIDNVGDAVYLDDSNIKQLQGGRVGTHLAIDFVCEAFSDLRKNIRSAANKNWISKESLFATNLIAHRSWTTGDLTTGYENYINKLYTTFVDSYLPKQKRTEKIKNYRDFTREFLKFILRTAEYFPFTKTGYITSIHSSPFASGLMLETSKENHGVHNNAKILSYLKDDSFTFFVNEVKKFGFMVDKNAPWRIVFNLASGMSDKRKNGNITGGQIYMDRFAVDFDNVFPVYFKKAHREELLNIQKKFYSLYESFYRQFSTYTVDKYVKCIKNEDSYDLRVVSERREREIPSPNIIGDKQQEIYWLKILFKLRLAETNTMHKPEDFNFLFNKILQNYEVFGLARALDEINDFTKGFYVTNFLSKGKYWYGISEKEYLMKRAKIDKEMIDPSLVQYSISGTGNIK